MKQSLNTSRFNQWYTNHHRWGGRLVSATMSWNEITHPEQYVDNLFAKFKKIPFEDVLAFSESNVTDNSMDHRDILEDASKIHMLRNKLRQKKMIFHPQLIHEPWHKRWRIHPGSGRAAAMWLEGYKEIECIYTYFKENTLELPKNITKEIIPDNFYDSIFFQIKSILTIF